MVRWERLAVQVCWRSECIVLVRSGASYGTSVSKSQLTELAKRWTLLMLYAEWFFIAMGICRYPSAGVIQSTNMALLHTDTNQTTSPQPQRSVC